VPPRRPRAAPAALQYRRLDGPQTRDWKGSNYGSLSMRKLVLVVVGLVFTGLALLGAVLPGLPTTPFLIVALWAFARSSRRLTLWLERVPILQSALRDAQ